MKIHSDYMTVQTKEKREFLNLTENVKHALEKSGIRDGFALVAALHGNSAVFVNNDSAGLLEDIDAWLQQLAPYRDNYQHGKQAESNASVHLQNLLLHNPAVVSIADGRLELGPWQQIFYAELDGQRPKRILIRVMGE